MTVREGWPDAGRRLLSLGGAAAARAASLGRQLAAALLTPRYPVYRLRGVARASGRPATVLVAGQEPWANYLPARFFAGEPAREPIGRVSLWALPGLLRRLRPSVDLTIARVDHASAFLFFRGDYLRVPQWIGSALEVPDDPAAYVGRSRSRREDARVARRQGLQPVVAHGTADFDRFYDTMYAPYVRRRHGELAYVAPRSSLRRFCRRGGILWIEREGERVAAMLFVISARTFYSVALGTAGGESTPRHQGGLAAAYLFGLECARQHGCALMNCGGSRPSLHDGVLRYKRKWGIALRDQPSNAFDLLVHWNRLDGAVADFLAHTSLIFRDGGGYSALHALNVPRPATGADALEARQALWIDGLQRLRLYNAAGWTPGAQAGPDVELLDPRSDCAPRSPRRGPPCPARPPGSGA